MTEDMRKVLWVSMARVLASLIAETRTYSCPSWHDMEQARREAMHRRAKADAAECDCWKSAGPICAKCKLRAFAYAS